MKLSFGAGYDMIGRIKFCDCIKHIDKDIISNWVVIFQRNERVLKNWQKKKLTLALK